MWHSNVIAEKFGIPEKSDMLGNTWNFRFFIYTVGDSHFLFPIIRITLVIHIRLVVWKTKDQASCLCFSTTGPTDPANVLLAFPLWMKSSPLPLFLALLGQRHSGNNPPLHNSLNRFIWNQPYYVVILQQLVLIWCLCTWVLVLFCWLLVSSFWSVIQFCPPTHCRDWKTSPKLGLPDWSPTASCRIF